MVTLAVRNKVARSRRATKSTEDICASFRRVLNRTELACYYFLPSGHFRTSFGRLFFVYGTYLDNNDLGKRR